MLIVPEELVGLMMGTIGKNLGEDHSHLPEQDPVHFTIVGIQERVLDMKSRSAPGPDVNHWRFQDQRGQHF